MAYRKIPEAKTDRLKIGETVYDIQELPYTAVLDVVAEGSDVIKAVVAEAAKTGNITNLDWQQPVTDEDGNPVLEVKRQARTIGTGDTKEIVKGSDGEPILDDVIDEATGEPVMIPKRQFNVELILGLLFTAVRQLRSKADFFPKLIDAAIVDQEGRSFVDDLTNLTAGTMLKAVRKVLVLSLAGDSSLGEELAAAFKTEKKSQTPAADQAPGTGSSTGSSELPTLAPSNSAPPQPPLASSGAPAPVSPSAAVSPGSAPSSPPATPPVT